MCLPQPMAGNYSVLLGEGEKGMDAGSRRETLTIVSPNETSVFELFVTNLNSC